MTLPHLFLIACLTQPQVRYTEDFASYAPGADGAPTLQVVGGHWEVTDGAYAQTRLAKDEAYSFWRTSPVSDFTFSARFYVHPNGPGVKAAGLVFRSQDSGRLYFAHYDSKHSQMILYLTQRPRQYTELARVAGVPIAAQQWHTAKITCTGPQISVFLDGKLLTTVEDSTYLWGWVGLRTGQGKILFDDLHLEGVPALAEKEWSIVPESVQPTEENVPRLEGAERVVALRGGGYFPVMIKLQDGRLGAVVRGGDAHVGIKGRLDWIESSDGGKTWSQPRVIVDSQWDDRNPALGQMPNGDIVVAYAECHCYNAQGRWDPKAGSFEFYYVVSRDGARTWSEKRPLFRGPLGGNASPYGRIITLSDGTALMSQYGDLNPDYSGPVRLQAPALYIVGLVRSRDNGATWDDFSVVCPTGHNETSLLELPDGALLAAMRTDGGQVAQATSTDRGYTWSQPVRVTGGPDGTKSQHPADIIRLQSGNLLMVYGNRLEPYGVGAILSYDNGKTWDYDHRVLLGWTSLNSDCGYPSAVQLDDGTIVCMYYSVGTEELPDDWQAIVLRFTEDQLRPAL